MDKDEVLKRYNRAVSTILWFFPELGYVTYQWKVLVQGYDLTVYNTDTFATSYDTLVINPEFLSTLKFEELVGVILHEIAHCVYLHPTELTKLEAEDKNPEIWNICLEIVANCFVISLSKNYPDRIKLPGEPLDPFKLDFTQISSKPKNNIYFFSYLGFSKTSSEIYQLLKEEFKSLQPNERSTIRSILPMDVIKDKGVIGEKKEVFEEKGGIFPEETAIFVLDSLSKRIGDLPMEASHVISKLTKSDIPWKRILSSFIMNIVQGIDDFGWERINMKKADEIILPGPFSRETDLPVVVVDTSGSTVGLIKTFASGVAPLFSFFPKVRFITTDVRVHEDLFISSSRDIVSKVKFIGGGGTSFEEIFQKVKSCPFMIFFTDGYASYPKNKPRYPVLWVLSKDCSKPPFGKVVYILNV